MGTGESLLWKQPGTDCENRPEAHAIVQVLDTIGRIAAPSISLISGAMAPGGHDFVTPGECRAGYDSILMSAVWESLATADTRLLAHALANRSSGPTRCAQITYLQSHDDIGWWFDDEAALAFGIDPTAHREYLTAFYSGNWALSNARGQVGFGRIAQSHDMPGVIKSGLADFVAICELDAKRLADGVAMIEKSYADRGIKAPRAQP